MSLDNAHKGYEYQDLFTTLRLVDVLLQRVAALEVDQKLFTDDIFDDLTTTWTNGARIRQQLKHSDNPKPFTKESLTTQLKRCRLDELLFSAVIDKKNTSQATEYRLLVSDTYSEVEDIGEYMIVDTAPASFPGLPTWRFKLNAEKIWPTTLPDGNLPNTIWKQVIKHMRSKSLSRDEFVWFTEHFILELGMPAASLDLTSPGLLEEALLNRLIDEIGTGIYPNENRMGVDVAAQLIAAARAARSKTDNTSRETLLRRAQLRDDFGQVARAYPLEANSEVRLVPTLETFAAKVDNAIKASVPLLVVGPPGQGKTWAADRMSRTLQEEGWLVASHYCYLNGSEDEYRSKRVRTEAIIGSLMAQLAEQEPSCVDEMRPRYAVNTEILISTLRKIKQKNPKRKIALFIDGVDHITRVVSAGASVSDPATDLSKELVRMDLPEGVLLIVTCQPGAHDVPFKEAKAEFYGLPSWNIPEVKQLGEKLNVITEQSNPSAQSIVAHDDPNLSKLVAILTEKSKGNALYATYCYREIKQAYGIRKGTAVEICEIVEKIPAFDGTMKAYYEYLVSNIPDESLQAADLLAVLEFAVTRDELKAIYPLVATYIDAMVERLSPVLAEKAQQGGIRVYHESFQRFLLEDRLIDPHHKQSVISPVITWLSEKGFISDARAFRFTLSLMLEAGQIADIGAFIPLNFGAQAIAACHGEAAIMKNISVAAEAAVVLNDWEALVRYSEQAKGISAYFTERIDSTLQSFSDIPITLFGAEWLARRLLFEGRTVFPAYLGLHLCEDIDKAGGVAPWKVYLDAYGATGDGDDPYYGKDRPRSHARCEIRGQLRLVARGDLDVDNLANWLDQPGLPDPDDITEMLLDIYGSGKLVLEVVDKLPQKHRSAYILALAKRHAVVSSEKGLPDQKSLVKTAISTGLQYFQIIRALNLGADPGLITLDEKELLDQTKGILDRNANWDERQVGKWLSLVFVAAYKSSDALSAVELLVQGKGWYRDWLGYVIDLARYKAAPGDGVLPIFAQLANEKNPFAGSPRACDLYSIHSLIASTLRMGLDLIRDEEWKSVLETLREVREHTTTSLQGSISGPLTPGLLLELATEYTSSARKKTTDDFVSGFFDETLESSTYYDDIAEHHLRKARLLLASGDRNGAEEQWNLAAKFNTCNGHRKDITLYELLDSMPSLINFDLQEARQRIARVKVLMERVLMHTDLKETRHALPRWWDLVTRADGIGAANLIAEQMLATPNRHAWRLREAAFKLYEAHAHKLEPGLRFTVRSGLGYNSSLNKDDAELLDTLQEAGIPDLPLYLAADTITAATQDRVTDNHDDDKYDLEGITKLVESSQRLDGHKLLLKESVSPENENNYSRPDNIQTRIDKGESISWGETQVEVERAIRRWSQRSYDIYRSKEMVAAAENGLIDALGWRLLVLGQQGKEDTAENILRFLGEHIGYSNPSYVLSSLAEGFHRHGFDKLAVIAYVLAYTKSRGDGWRTFGGTEYEHLLKSAVALDTALALKELGSAMVHVINGEYYGIQGISQGLISAFTAIDTAKHVNAGPLELWDAAASVIELRLPGIGATDDDTDPYIPTLAAADTQEALELAIATAVISGLAHPERNLKRRALLSTVWLIKIKQNITTDGVMKVLQSEIDPGGKSWLLWVLESFETDPYPITKHCQATLNELAKSNLLTVRALSRQLLVRAGLPAPPIPATPPKPLPSRISIADEKVRRNYFGATSEMRRCAGERIDIAAAHYPDLESNVSAILGGIFNDEDFQSAYRRQIEGLTNVTSRRPPDAYTKEQVAVEQTLQEVAAGARVAVARRGDVVTDPSAYEDELAQLIIDSPDLPLRFEISRIPRPKRLKELAVANSAVPVPVVKDGPYKGWVIIGVYEADITPGDRYKKIDRKVTIYEGGVESAAAGSSHSHPSVFGYGVGQIWLREVVDSQPSHLLSDFKGPLIGVEYESLPQFYGLGSADPLLVPNLKLVHRLGLLPGPNEHGFSLIDKSGKVGIVARTWRTEFIDGEDYGPAYPLIEGMDVLLRPDLFSDFEKKVLPQQLRFCSRHQ